MSSLTCERDALQLQLAQLREGVQQQQQQEAVIRETLQQQQQELAETLRRLEGHRSQVGAPQHTLVPYPEPGPTPNTLKPQTLM